MKSRVRVMEQITRKDIMEENYNGRLSIKRSGTWLGGVSPTYTDHDGLFLYTSEGAFRLEEGEMVKTGKIKRAYTENTE